MSESVRQALVMRDRATGDAQSGLRHLLLDLHDGPMQLLYAALLQLELLQASLGGEAEPAHRTRQLETLLQRAATELRALIDRERPPVAESQDLLSMLREVAAEHQVSTQTRVRIVAEHIRDPGPAGRHALYRVLQESLSNAFRHGKAAEVAVRLGLSEDAGGQHLWMLVEDDGCGFDASVVSSRDTGLSGMSERMRAAGGALAVWSAPGGGTMVRAALAI